MTRTPDALRIADARRSGSLRRIIGVWRRMTPDDRGDFRVAHAELADALDQLDAADADVARLSVGRGLFVGEPGRAQRDAVPRNRATQ